MLQVSKLKSVVIAEKVCWSLSYKTLAIICDDWVRRRYIKTLLFVCYLVYLLYVYRMTMVCQRIIHVKWITGTVAPQAQVVVILLWIYNHLSLHIIIMLSTGQCKIISINDSHELIDIPIMSLMNFHLLWCLGIVSNLLMYSF